MAAGVTNNYSESGSLVGGIVGGGSGERERFSFDQSK